MTSTRTPSRARLIERAAQPYVATRHRVPMAELGQIADDLPLLFDWLAAQGLTPTGSPFFKYDLLLASGDLEVEVGLPVEPAGKVLNDADNVDGRFAGRLRVGVLPGGRFAVLTHLGHPDGLLEATATLLDWGTARNLRWDMSETGGDQHWGLRLEIYKTDPAREPDLNAWETEILLRLADGSPANSSVGG